MSSTFMTIVIIAITAIISFAAFSNKNLLNKLISYPYIIKREKQWYRLLTSGFIHADIGHLAFNMITLFFFGPAVERYMEMYFGLQSGRIIYLLFYLVAIVVSSIPSYIKHQDNSYYRSLGASGGVSAVLFASILIFPQNSIIIFPIPIGIPAWLFGPAYLFYSAYMAKRGNDNIGHEAHFMGAVFGLIAIVILIPETFGNFIQEITSLF